MSEEFSVLMSVYIKEKAEYFHQCMESIFAQTILPQEIVIVEDGPISEELERELFYYQEKNKELIKIIKLKENCGLGLALAEGLLHCSNEIVARMDTDDICVPQRFELQLEEFKKDLALDICGSNIVEFCEYPENQVSVRKVPLIQEDIIKHQKYRSAFNHMTVMFKKSAVLKVGNYKHCPLMEDDLLWCEMLKTGSYCVNISEPLVYARTGIEMIKRRGGIDYFFKYYEGRKRILETGFISRWNFYSTCLVQFFVCIIPWKLRFCFFKKLLRS